MRTLTYANEFSIILLTIVNRLRYQKFSLRRLTVIKSHDFFSPKQTLYMNLYQLQFDFQEFR